MFDTQLDEINLHVRDGSILPLQEPDVVTARSRKKPFGLLYTLPEDETTGKNSESKVAKVYT